MTNNDPFTEAARAEAGRRWRDPALDHDPIGMAVDLALWARARLAAQEPTDAEVEAAAEAWSKSFTDCDPQREAWKPGGDISTRYASIERARAALSAARKA